MNQSFSLDQYATWCLSRGIKPSTVSRTHVVKARTVLREIGDPATWTLDSVIRFLSRYEKPATWNAYIDTIHSLRDCAELPRFELKHKKKVERAPLSLEAGRDAITDLLRACLSPMHRVMFLMLRYGGFRISELLALRARDLELHDDYIVVRFIREKTGTASMVTLVEPCEDIRRYLAATGMKGTDRLIPLSYGGARNAMRRVAERAGVSWHFHEFRHYRATEMARDGYAKEELDNLFGWAHSSNTASTYVNLSVEDTNRKVLERAGIVAPRAPSLRLCWRCNTRMPVESDRCPRCHAPFKPAEVVAEERARESEKSRVDVLEEQLSQLIQMLAGNGGKVVSDTRTRELRVL